MNCSEWLAIMTLIFPSSVMYITGMHMEKIRYFGANIKLFHVEKLVYVSSKYLHMILVCIIIPLWLAKKG